MLKLDTIILINALGIFFKGQILKQIKSDYRGLLYFNETTQHQSYIRCYFAFQI